MNLLFLTAYPIEDASCRYRVYQFLPLLEQAGYRCEVSSFCTPSLFHALKLRGNFSAKLAEALRCSARRFAKIADLSEFHAIVIHREAFPFFAPLVENRVLRRHPRVIFSLDDAIYAGHRKINHFNHPFLYRWKHGRGYAEVIRRSMHVIAGNRVLADYARALNPNVSVIPTVVDCNQYEFRPPEKRSSQPLTIGWMGSPSTAPQLALIEPALRRLSIVHRGGVRFRFIGHPEYTFDVADSSSLPFRLEHEVEDLYSFDIGLMPLEDSEWARGKCAFKAIQYMACGVPVVASPVGITTDLIQHGVNGLLATSSDEWFNALNQLLTNTSLRQKLALAARRTIESSYSLQVWGPRLVTLFDRLTGRVVSQFADVAA